MESILLPAISYWMQPILLPAVSYEHNALKTSDFATGCIHILELELELVLELSRRGATSSVMINLCNFTPVRFQKPRH